MANHSDYSRRAELRSFHPTTDRDHRSFASRLITERQLECLSWVQEGKSATDIGGILGLSGRTVEKHIIKVCGHLGVKTRIQAVVRARELGLITANAP
ncbi:MAG: LuxR C-terminal-related transcriptional regulator [Caulobacteraceae bacterium]